ncbi:hypothetical protein MGS_04906 [Candida albicans P78042]|nr:hypothetical protein MGS_04906 [Candida albicans P78042]
MSPSDLLIELSEFINADNHQMKLKNILVSKFILKFPIEIIYKILSYVPDLYLLVFFSINLKIINCKSKCGKISIKDLESYIFNNSNDSLIDKTKMGGKIIYLDLKPLIDINSINYQTLEDLLIFKKIDFRFLNKFQFYIHSLNVKHWQFPLFMSPFFIRFINKEKTKVEIDDWNRRIMDGLDLDSTMISAATATTTTTTPTPITNNNHNSRVRGHHHMITKPITTPIITTTTTRTTSSSNSTISPFTVDVKHFSYIIQNLKNKIPGFNQWQINQQKIFFNNIKNTNFQFTLKGVDENCWFKNFNFTKLNLKTYYLYQDDYKLINLFNFNNLIKLTIDFGQSPLNFIPHWCQFLQNLNNLEIFNLNIGKICLIDICLIILKLNRLIEFNLKTFKCWTQTFWKWLILKLIKQKYHGHHCSSHKSNQHKPKNHCSSPGKTKEFKFTMQFIDS